MKTVRIGDVVRIIDEGPRSLQWKGRLGIVKNVYPKYLSDRDESENWDVSVLVSTGFGEEKILLTDSDQLEYVAHIGASDFDGDSFGSVGLFSNQLTNYLFGKKSAKPVPKRIIYNDPATIVFWTDNTKTIVKCAEGEPFNKYFGFCAALAKKIYGTNSEVTRIVRDGVDQSKKELESKLKKIQKEDGATGYSKLVEKIMKMKNAHRSYAAIAKELDMSEESVKTIVKEQKAKWSK